MDGFLHTNIFHNMLETRKLRYLNHLIKKIFNPLNKIH